MDPLCHTLVGSALAGTRLGERSWGARAALIVGANLPDVDVLAYFWGSDAALGFRRGWTHGVLALVLLPLLLATTVHLLGRARGAPSDPRRLLALSAIAVGSHPLLDWMNTYGMRWLMPFDGTWFYGDALFIVDPWLWAILGGASFLAFSGARSACAAWAGLGLAASLAVLGTDLVPLSARIAWVALLVAFAGARWATGPLSPPAAHRLATLGLVIAGLYVGTAFFWARASEHAVATSAPGAGAPSGFSVYTGPLPARPVARDVLLVYADAYRPGRWQPLEGGLLLRPEALPIGDQDELVRAALEAPCAQGMRTWLRFPFFRVEPAANGGRLVDVMDARYVRGPSSGFGATRVLLDADGRPVGCR